MVIAKVAVSAVGKRIRKISAELKGKLRDLFQRRFKNYSVRCLRNELIKLNERHNMRLPITQFSYSK